MRRTAALIMALALLYLPACGMDGGGAARVWQLELSGEAAAFAEMMPGEDALAFGYEARGAQGLEAAAYACEGGEWRETSLRLEFASAPEEGMMVLSFDCVASGFGITVFDIDGRSRTMSTASAAAPGECSARAYASDAEGGDIALCVEYYGECPADIGHYAHPESIPDGIKAYALVIRFK